MPEPKLYDILMQNTGRINVRIMDAYSIRSEILHAYLYDTLAGTSIMLILNYDDHEWGVQDYIKLILMNWEKNHTDAYFKFFITGDDYIFILELGLIYTLNIEMWKNLYTSKK